MADKIVMNNIPSMCHECFYISNYPYMCLKAWKRVSEDEKYVPGKRPTWCPIIEIEDGKPIFDINLVNKYRQQYLENKKGIC